MTLRNRQWQEHVDSVLGDLNKSSVIPSKGFEAWEEIAIGLPNAFKCVVCGGLVYCFHPPLSHTCSSCSKSEKPMEPRQITYCSFATKTECLGVVVLDGNFNAVQACFRTRERGLNPGKGELMVVSCKETDEDVPSEIFEAMWNNRNRLIPAEEARLLFDAASLKEMDAASLLSEQDS